MTKINKATRSVMKDLDRNEVYDLRGATSEQLDELYKWLRYHEKGWVREHREELKTRSYIRVLYGSWCYGENLDVNPTTHISTLFEDEFVLPKNWCIKGGSELAKYFLDNSISLSGSSNQKIYFLKPNDRWDWGYACDNTYRTEITFEQFEKYVLKVNKEMEKPKLTVTRQALSEIYGEVCYNWQKKIESILNKSLFRDEFEVPQKLVEEAYKASDRSVQREWLEKYFPQPKKMKLISCLQAGTDLWAAGGYSIDPLCTYERIQSFKDGLDVILKTNGNYKVLYLGYWNNGKY